MHFKKWNIILSFSMITSLFSPIAAYASQESTEAEITVKEEKKEVETKSESTEKEVKEEKERKEESAKKESEKSQENRSEKDDKKQKDKEEKASTEQQEPSKEANQNKENTEEKKNKTEEQERPSSASTENRYKESSEERTGKTDSGEKHTEATEATEEESSTEKRMQENKKKSSKKKKEDDDDDDVGKEYNYEVNTENRTPTMPEKQIPSDLAQGDSYNSAHTVKYGMPEESIHGFPSYSKEKIKEYDEKISENNKSIESLNAEKEKKQSVLDAVTDSISKVSLAPSADGQAYSLGTKRIIAKTERQPLESSLDENLGDLALYTGDIRLINWVKSYTLDYYASFKDVVEVNPDDTSDVLPILNTIKEETTGEINVLSSKIERLQKDNQCLEDDKAKVEIERMFDPNDVTKPSNITENDAITMLKDTNLEHLAGTFVACEKDYGINAVFIMSIAIHESGWGNSPRARYDHNFTGYGVYSSSAKGINSDRDEDNIRLTASKLMENYLSEDGKYYKGKRVCDVHETYCATGEWSKGVCSAAYRVMERLIDNPVYEIIGGSAVDPNSPADPSAQSTEEDQQTTSTESQSTENPESETSENQKE